MLKTIEQYEKETRESIRERDEMRYKTGIECPQCKKELRYTNPNITLTSYPPQKSVGCECGFRTSVVVGG